ncbi:hypothetical protein OHQ89_27875 [Streptomyces canus]|uniref:hypothetical protein n=1 Tax=Streptomyces canus TaxID=58343 RepID=UPI0030E22394
MGRLRPRLRRGLVWLRGRSLPALAVTVVIVLNRCVERCREDFWPTAGDAKASADRSGGYTTVPVD